MLKRALEWFQWMTIEGEQREVKRRRLLPDDEAQAAADNAETSMFVDANDEDRVNESSNDDPVLQPNHKIFLSHSGAQKDFVEQLCVDLERRHHFPFFDKRSSSLPKGEMFPQLILKAAQQCRMAVVVVSQEYFMSKWPMIELHAFVQARLKSNTKLKILPLFYGLSVSQFRNEKRREQWFGRWEDWAKSDSRINVGEWKDSLHVMESFNGIQYNPSITTIRAFQEDIVANICTDLVADITWDDSHVQGRVKLCQAIYNKIEEIQPSRMSKACSVGFYGVGGIGKTTISKTLCNELYREFEGKVCHIEFGSESFEVLIKKVLKDLTNTREELLQEISEGECRGIFRKVISKRRIFLAIDNVWDDSESIEQAKMYLHANLHEGSAVMVTSRSLKTLSFLGINDSHCFEMPELKYEDAKNLFLYHAAHGSEFLDSDDQSAIKECVALCYFRKGDVEWPYRYHYLPLALKALGVQVGCVGKEPSVWKENLPKMKHFNHLAEKQNPVFSILRSSFDRLQSTEQSLFMDVVVYRPNSIFADRLLLLDWLSLVYNQNVQEIKNRLQHLKERGLLEDVELTSQRSISVHDLYKEFAKLESEGKLNESANFKKRKWVYYEDVIPSELEMTPSGRCWHKLTRIGIEESRKDGQQNLLHGIQGIDWKNCANVVVLRLEGLQKLRGSLNLQGLKCLRSLELLDIFHLESVDGLESLSQLTYFRWIHLYNFLDNMQTRMGQLPASLKDVEICLGFFLRSDAFARCFNLRNVKLYACKVERLDFSNCRALETATIQSIEKLESLDTLTAATTPNLQSLHVWTCKDLLEIPELGELVELKLLYLHGNSKLQSLPDVQKLTKLEVFRASQMGMDEIPGLGSLKQLRDLQCYNFSRWFQLPDLSALKRLETVDISANEGFSSLEGVLRDLPALRSLDISQCEMLRRLPDLSGMTSLEELDLRSTGVEMGERDLAMLAALPRLHPVKVGRRWGRPLRLDVGRRKVLQWEKQSYQAKTSGHEWLSWIGWDERELEGLPVQTRGVSSWNSPPLTP